MIVIVIAAIQNIGNNKRYNLGTFSCNVPNCIVIFIIKVIYVLFWTWILYLICNAGYTGLAWFLLLLPFIILFIVLALVMAYQNNNKKQRNNNRKR